VLVVLGTGGAPGRPTNSTAQPTDRSTSGQPTDQSNLVEVLCDQVVFLRQQLEEEREANREKRRIIAGLVQRVPELEPAQEAQEAPVSFSEESDKGFSTTPPEQQERSQAAGALTAPRAQLVAAALRVGVRQCCSSSTCS